MNTMIERFIELEGTLHSSKDTINKLEASLAKGEDRLAESDKLNSGLIDEKVIKNEKNDQIRKNMRSSAAAIERHGSGNIITNFI